jgi:hypothetical protein
MIHASAINPVASRRNYWLWLLTIPCIAILWVPIYNKIEPVLWGIPFFYWYQMACVLIGAIITAFVYLKTGPFEAILSASDDSRDVA